MRKLKKQPPILKLKIEVANLIKNKCKIIEYRKHPRGYYWSGEFQFENKKIHVTWQNYTRRFGVEFINMFYINSTDKSQPCCIHIYKKELNRIKSVLSDEKR